VEEMKRICAIEGVRVDAGDEEGQAAIHKASEQGHLEAVRYLVDEMGVNPQAYPSTTQI